MPTLNPHPDPELVYCCPDCGSSNLWQRVTDGQITCTNCDTRHDSAAERERQSDYQPDPDGIPPGIDTDIAAKIERLRAVREGKGA